MEGVVSTGGVGADVGARADAGVELTVLASRWPHAARGASVRTPRVEKNDEMVGGGESTTSGPSKVRLERTPCLNAASTRVLRVKKNLAGIMGGEHRRGGSALLWQKRWCDFYM